MKQPVANYGYALSRVGSGDVTREVTAISIVGAEAGREVREDRGELIEGDGGEPGDGLLCHMAPRLFQFRQERPTRVGQLDDRGAPVGR